MAITTVSSREFNQETSRVKRSADAGPVFITDRGRASYVLLSIREYERLKGPEPSIADLLYMPGAADIEFDPPRLGDEMVRPADLS